MLGAGALAVPAGSVYSNAQGWVCFWCHVLVQPILPPPVQMAVDGSRAAVAPGVAQLFSAEEQRRSWEKSSKGQQRARLHL